MPNSDDLFTIGFRNQPKELDLHTKGIQVFDKNMDVYYEIADKNFRSMANVCLFHPFRPALAAGSRTGQLNVFI